jgi:hypothetical protein
MYGQNSGQLRDALGILLRQHRIQQRLGGKGTHTVPETTTAAEREDLGRQIRRYRQCVLTWCLEAVNATDLRLDAGGITRGSRGPAEELGYRLATAVAASTAGLARSEELVKQHQFSTVESWRQAGRAAALGEHDFAAGVGYGRLSKDQCLTVLSDAADVVRGLVALDRRYAGVPGWETLTGQRRLQRAAEVCAAQARCAEPDYTIDLRGWRPAPWLAAGPALTGLAGIIQAQHDLLLQLDEFPNAHSLRVVMDSQRVVARAVSLRIAAVAPGLAAKWATRSQTYGALVRATRDLGGMLGTSNAAGHGSIAAGRADKLDNQPLTDARQLRHLDWLFARIDERVCAAVQAGADQRLYFLRVPLPRIDDQAPGMVKGRRHRFVPITSSGPAELTGLVRTLLLPCPARPTRPSSPAGAAQGRADFAAAITHRPGDPGPTLSV